MANGKMNPSRFGSVPEEANKQGTLNETLPPDQRNRPAPAELAEGPKRGDKGEFLPAAYKTKNGAVREDR